MQKILLIDDDVTMAGLLKTLLAQHDFDLVSASRPSQTVDLLDDEVDLLLLDVMLPEMDGFELCRFLREGGEARPIIMLTAKGDDMDRIRGLQLGADDYLPKPFNHLELVARIQAVLRRSARPVPATKADGLDQDRRVLRLGGRDVPLTPMEFRLLEALTARAGRVFTRGELLNLLDSENVLESFDRAVDLHVSRLRTKLEENPKQPRHLVTVRGVGYRFEW